MSDRKLLNIELGRIKADQYRELPPSGIVLVLDNIRSAHNVGSAFRTGDAFKVDKVWLCGICATPPSAEIHKVALGAEQSVPWEHVDDTLALVQRLRAVAGELHEVAVHQHAPLGPSGGARGVDEGEETLGFGGCWLRLSRSTL